jgi:hypothetical protein
MNALLLGSAATLLLAVGYTRLWPRAPRIPTGRWATVSDTLAKGPPPPLRVATVQGDTVSVPSTRGGILIAYRSTCRFCEASIQQWQQLAADRCDTQVILVSDEQLPVQARYWRDKPWTRGAGCAAPIIGRPVAAGELTGSYGVRSIPLHFVIDSLGRTVGIWKGAIPNRQALDAFTAGPRSREGSARGTGASPAAVIGSR